MNGFLKITMAVFAIFCCKLLNAQLIANAGSDTTVCAGNRILLGGAPTARGGAGPYSYKWIPGTGLSCDTCANPYLIPGLSANYFITVVDSVGDTARTSVRVMVNQSPSITIQSSDTVVCSGQQVYLQATSSANTGSCGYVQGCNGNITPVQIGTGDILQAATGLSDTGLLGNWSHSSRHQMLYKASELSQAFGGAVTISEVSFRIGQFNSNEYLQNFVIRIGCSSVDSLIDWDNDVLSVYQAALVQPIAGWNTFHLDSSFAWDGETNLVIELCNYNPVTQRNQANLALCSVTQKSSYIFSGGNNNQCDNVTAPFVSNVRPNIKFGYCTTTSSAEFFQWQARNIYDSVLSPGNLNTYANPVNSTTYYLNVSNINGCANTDSVHVTVRPVSVSAYLPFAIPACPGQFDGAVAAVVFSADTVRYQLFNANYSLTLFSGEVWNNDTVSFTNLGAGTYHLLLSDSVCTNLDNAVTVNTRLLSTDTNISTPTCPLFTNGAIQAKLFCDEDSIYYKLLSSNLSTVLDSGKVADSSVVVLTSLVQGSYSLILSDSFCTVLYDITLSEPQQPNYTGNSFTASCYHDSTANGCVNISGGTPPFGFTWSDPAISGGCPLNVPSGTYNVTISDANNCSTVALNIIVPLDTFSAQIIGNVSNFEYDSVTIAVVGGFPPYSVIWGDGNADNFGQTDSHHYTSAGPNLIIVTDAYSCSTADTIYSSLLLGIPQNTLAGLKIFPNPVTDHLFVESPQSPISEIEILDVTGNEVAHRYLDEVRQSTLDISAFSSGVYLLLVRLGELKYRERVVKY